MGKSDIEWIDNGVPIVTGCQKIGAGCRGCYSVPLSWRLAHNPHPALADRYAGTVEKRDGKLVWTGKININLDQLTAIEQAKRPQSWFLSHVGDLFHDDVPPAVVDAVLAVAALKPDQQVVLLTHRPHRMAKLLANGPKPLPNVWLGASISTDREAEDAVGPLSLLAGECWQTWVSYEPALGPIRWSAYGYEFLYGIIGGGESGPHGRATHPVWHTQTAAFCKENEIPFYFKQHGRWQPRRWKGDGATHALHVYDGQFLKLSHHPDSMERAEKAPDGWQGFADVGKKAAGRILDGRTWDDLPWRRAA